MPQAGAHHRQFLLLQGPHGPWFQQLGTMLRKAGCGTWRVAFNKGDENFWFHQPSLIRFTGSPADWPARCAELMQEKGITDLVLYGDTRPIHATAIALAQARGITVHVFEEGYLRPYWITYERGGSNGHSRLMQMTVQQMRDALAQSEVEQHPAPSRWGDMRQHIFYGALYHFFVMVANGPYRQFRPHRDLTVFQEFHLYLRRLLLLPWHILERWIATSRIRIGGFPYHLVLMQLEHDASFRMHSPFSTMSEFLELCVAGFAKGAPKHHHLVFKAHPLEDGRVAVQAKIRAFAAAYGVQDRVHFVRGGKLARLLAQARSAVTVNSTAGQQVLWRGLALRAFGRAVYDKPEFVSSQPLAEFFAQPRRPDAKAYREYRAYLLETSQIPGGYYSAQGRRQLLRQVVDMLLAAEDPYEALTSGNAAPRQQLRLVE